MGGYNVEIQPYRVYQGIVWICDKSSSLDNQLNGVRRIRDMVEMNKTDDVIKLGIPSRLIELLQETNDDLLQSEIVWTLSNIAAGSSRHTSVVVRKGLHILIKLLDGDCSLEVKNNVIWALSNIAGDCAEFRDQLLKNGVMERVLRLLDSPIDLELEKICYWLVSNLCRHKNPAPNFEIVSQCVPYLARCLKYGHPEAMSNACWALKYLADGPWYQINAIIKAGICKSLVEILNDGQSNTVGVLLVCINIASGSYEQTQELLNCGIIAVLSKLLNSSHDDNVLKNIAFLVSNIAADEQQKIQDLIDADIFSKLAKIFGVSGDQTQIEILHAIENATLNGDNDQVIIIASGCTEILNAAIDLNSEARKISLQTLWNIAIAQKEKSQALTSVRNSKQFFNSVLRKVSVAIKKNLRNTERIQNFFHSKCFNKFQNLKVYSKICKLQQDDDEEIANITASLANLL